MQDRPAPDELLDAVASFLREQVTGASGAPLAFHARVAANAIDIVRRELQLAPAASARERAALVRLLNADPASDVAQLNRLLCERIAAGEMDLATPGLAEALWQITLDKLAVDQPTYDTYLRSTRAARDEER
jgi:uncharacterized protein DUF6285